MAAALQGALAAGELAPAPPQAMRPRIGLVLGGGGAKGAAHIGVIKVLEEMRIPIDCIAGTSMGSIVGAAYATGLSAADLEQLMTAVDWRGILSSAPRQDIPVHRKSRDFFFSNGLEFGLKDGSLVAPGGLVPTHQIEGLFRRIVSGAAQVDDFDKLPIPFRAVATDLETGEMVVFDRGELAVAMRASMAVPAAFAPVEYNGRLLVDGMLVRNLPVDVARKTCADVVIAVPVANPAVTREKLGSFLGVAGQALNIAIAANEKAQLATLTERDIQIKVILEDIGSADFSKVPEAIPIGEAAARAAVAQLSRYSLSPREYAAWRADLGKLAVAPKVTIDEVHVSGLHDTSAEVANAIVRTRPGETYDPAKADADANRLVARGDYTAVGYGIAVERGGRNVLTYDATEKPWGPNYVTFDLNLSTDFKGLTQWGIRADYEKRWLNALGGEFRTSVQLGAPNAFAAQFYQPLEPAQRFFVAPIVFGSQQLEYLYSGDTAVGQYDTRRIGGGLDVGTAFGSWGELRIGLQREGVDTIAKAGNPRVPDPGRHALAAVTAQFVYDSVDKRIFPTAGTRATASIYSSQPGLGADRRYQTVALDLTTTNTWQANAWQFSLHGGSDLGSNVPFYDQFKVGGLFNFSGYRYEQLVGREYALAGLQYRRRAAFLNETLGTAVYSGLSLEVGNVYKRLDGTPATGVLVGGALFLAVDSKIGPLYLAYGRSEGGRSAVYLYLGSSAELYPR
ncbi:MAG TPA: patatin-like phospholipase family protein [Caldimonas sp.]|nr:patatin-like phospholipase family protein [Caldimonas sp.]HEX4234685.1 patatin-like phospholipase family protein [Caldimonas sp.]